MNGPPIRLHGKGQPLYPLTKSEVVASWKKVIGEGKLDRIGVSKGPAGAKAKTRTGPHPPVSARPGIGTGGRA